MSSVNHFNPPYCDVRVGEGYWKEVVRRIECCNHFQAIVNSRTVYRMLKRHQPGLLSVRQSEKNLVLGHYLYLFLHDQLQDSIRLVLIESDEVRANLFTDLDDVRDLMKERKILLKEVDDYYDRRRKELLRFAFDFFEADRESVGPEEDINATMTEVMAIRMKAQLTYGELQIKAAKSELSEAYRYLTFIHGQLENNAKLKADRRQDLIGELYRVRRKIKKLKAQRDQARRIIKGQESPPSFIPNLFHHGTSTHQKL